MINGMGRIRGWPATLVNSDFHDAPVALRPVRFSDARVLREIRAQNAAWLRPWEPSNPETAAHPPLIRRLRAVLRPVREMARLKTTPRLGQALPWIVTYDDQVVGQITIGPIVWSSLRSGQVGAWIDKSFARQGITGTAMAMAVDYCFQVAGLHRLEALIRPENVPSRRAWEKYGWREEGVRVRYVHIDGAWQDHVCYAITAEEMPEGATVRWRSLRSASNRPVTQEAESRS